MAMFVRHILDPIEIIKISRLFIKDFGTLGIFRLMQCNLVWKSEKPL